MHHYRHHIGDFDAATRHLTRVERSVYRDMIERYYDSEMPFRVDELDRVRRRCLIVSDEERAAFDLVLEEFFYLDGDAWRHARCDRDLAEYRETEQGADARRRHEADRKARHRERRAELFAALRTVGVVPDFNTDVKALEAMLAQHVPQLSQGTRRGQDAEVTTKPVTSNHKPVISPPTPPPVGGGVKKYTRSVDKSFPDGFGIDESSPDGMTEDVKAVARRLHAELRVDWTAQTLRHHLDQFRAHVRSQTGRAKRSDDWLARWESWCRKAMCEQPAADPVRRNVQLAAQGRARDSPGAVVGASPPRWDATPQATIDKARELGVEARPGETIGQLRERVAQRMAEPVRPVAAMATAEACG